MLFHFIGYLWGTLSNKLHDAERQQAYSMDICDHRGYRSFAAIIINKMYSPMLRVKLNKM